MENTAALKATSAAQTATPASKKVLTWTSDTLILNPPVSSSILNVNVAVMWSQTLPLQFCAVTACQSVQMVPPAVKIQTASGHAVHYQRYKMADLYSCFKMLMSVQSLLIYLHICSGCPAIMTL